MNICNPSAQGVEAGGSEVQGPPRLHSELEASLSPNKQYPGTKEAAVGQLLDRPAEHPCKGSHLLSVSVTERWLGTHVYTHARKSKCAALTLQVIRRSSEQARGKGHWASIQPQPYLY